MAPFLSRLLRYLGGSYAITGSEVTTRNLDLSGVQLVQEASRYVAAGRPPGFQKGWGYISANTTFTATSGAQTGAAKTFSIDPYRLGNSAGSIWPAEVPSELDLWLFDTSLTWSRILAGSSEITAGQAWMFYPANMNIASGSAAQQNARIWLQEWGDLGLQVDPGNSIFLQRALDRDSRQLRPDPPTFIPKQAPGDITDVMQCRLVADLDGTGNGDQVAIIAHVQYLVRAVPTGAPPI